MGNWDDGHMDAGWGVAMTLGMLGFGVLLAVVFGFAIFWTVRSSSMPTATGAVPPAGSATGVNTAGAEQILAERLARGDIDIEDYTTRLETLGTQRTP